MNVFELGLDVILPFEGIFTRRPNQFTFKLQHCIKLVKLTNDTILYLKKADLGEV